MQQPQSAHIDAHIEEILSRLEAAHSITVLTGAGVSAESGMPTFRGPEGVWRNFRPDQLATPEAFENNPHLVWEWYDWRRKRLASIEPNAAHYALAEMKKWAPQFTLITQNIDGLHRKAGSQNILEIHGNLWKVSCTHCKAVTDNLAVPIDIPPTCQDCDGLLRPHVVWFGEMLPQAELRASQYASRACDLMFVIGTSGVVQPAASFAVLARQSDAYVVEINIEHTTLSGVVNQTCVGKASKILTRLNSRRVH